MNSIRIRPSVASLVNAQDLSKMIDNLFNDCGCTPAPAGQMTAQTTSFPIDITENATSYTIRADVPGFSKDQLDISVHEQTLIIKATSTQTTETMEGTGHRYLRRERSVTNLERRFSLPTDIVEDQIAADLKDGVLSLVLPKAPKNTPRKVTVA